MTVYVLARLGGAWADVAFGPPAGALAFVAEGTWLEAEGAAWARASEVASSGAPCGAF